MDAVIFAIEILGTIAFAVSGVIVGKQKDMDLFGITALGVTTGVGGGIIRDVVIGHTPPSAFVNPIYGVVAALTALFLCIPYVAKFFNNYKSAKSAGDIFLQIFDAVGLGGFTVVAVANAYASFPNNIFLMVFVGCVSGVGGGVLRDIFAGDIPYIFRKHIYASASIAGALACALLMKVCSPTLAMLVGLLLVVLIRFLSAHFRLNLPHVKD